MEFEWDENKEEINIRKHGVNFNEAQEAFYDENAIDDYDEFHSGRRKTICFDRIVNEKTFVCIIYSSPKYRNPFDFSKKSESKSREILQ